MNGCSDGPTYCDEEAATGESDFPAEQCNNGTTFKTQCEAETPPASATDACCEAKCKASLPELDTAICGNDCVKHNADHLVLLKDSNYDEKVQILMKKMKNGGYFDIFSFSS